MKRCLPQREVTRLALSQSDAIDPSEKSSASHVAPANVLISS